MDANTKTQLMDIVRMSGVKNTKLTIRSSRWEFPALLKAQKLIDQEYLLKANTTKGETFKKRKLALWVEVGELANEWKELFKFWSNKKMDREKALTEYADGVHFILSLGNDLNVVPVSSDMVILADPIDQIFALSNAVVHIEGAKSFDIALSLFRGLGEHFGFTDKDIEASYFKKNEFNHNREDHVIK
jgi:dimeric dUTPase (all-alpha-NTP-PPase superfamily)